MFDLVEDLGHGTGCQERLRATLDCEAPDARLFVSTTLPTQVLESHAPSHHGFLDAARFLCSNRGRGNSVLYFPRIQNMALLIGRTWRDGLVSAMNGVRSLQASHPGDVASTCLQNANSRTYLH